MAEFVGARVKGWLEAKSFLEWLASIQQHDEGRHSIFVSDLVLLRLKSKIF